MAANEKIISLPNLGAVSAKMLAEIGVTNVQQLRQMGAVAAFCMVKATHWQPSLNLLYALHGALNGERWNRLSAETKSRLKADVDAFRFG